MGREAVAFRVPDGAVLVVTLQALSGVDGVAAPQDPTLAALARSLKFVALDETQAPLESQRECAVVERPPSGPTTLGLDGDACAVVADGAAVSVTIGGAARSLELFSGRDWLLVASSDAETTSAMTVMDLSTGAYLIIKAADGSELSRRVPDGQSDLASLFDALAQ